jgi:hypothetical protein
LISLIYTYIQLKTKPGAMIKLANRGHVVAKMHPIILSPSAAAASAGPLTAADFGISVNGGSIPSSQKSKNYYADSTVPSFFR